MSQGLFATVSGIRSAQTKLNVIANNIANVNTIAFKASNVNFQTLFSQTISRGTPPSSGLGGTNPKQIGTGVTIADIAVNFNEGGTIFTGRTNDMSISGNGFFTLQDPSNTTSYLLTRAGNLSLDADGYLVSSSGNKVLGTRTVDGDNPTTVGPILVPRELKIWKEIDPSTNEVVKTWIGEKDSTTVTDADKLASADTLTSGNVQLLNFTVGGHGGITGTYSNGDRITVQTDSSGQVREIRHLTAQGDIFSEDSFDASGEVDVVDSVMVPEQLQLRLATVVNPEGLLYEGQNNFSPSVNSGSPSFGIGANGNRGSVQAGSLESSNVDIANEFTSMIISQRGLEAASKAVSVQSDVLRTIIGIL